MSAMLRVSLSTSYPGSCRAVCQRSAEEGRCSTQERYGSALVVPSQPMIGDEESCRGDTGSQHHPRREGAVRERQPEDTRCPCGCENNPEWSRHRSGSDHLL